MRRSRAMVLVILGCAAVLAGVLGGSFALVPAFARGDPPAERALAVSMAVVAVGVVVFGGWLARYGVRAWNARIAELRAARMPPR